MPGALRDTLAALRRAPLLTGLSALMVGLALYVLGLFALAAFNLRQALASIEERVEVVAYLRDDSRPVDVDAALETLRTLPGVAEVRLVSKAEALEQAQRELPEIAEVSTDLEVNPFPASLEVSFLPGSRNAESVEPAVEAAAGIPIVEDVRYGQEWIERLFLLRRMAAITAITLGVAFAVVAALIIGTAIRIAVLARKDEIYIMGLVGARDSYIRRPFLLEGAITGLLGAVLAAGLTWATYQAVYRLLFTLAWIPASWILGGLGAGTLFGILASGLAVHRYLRDI
jgi:cell division transport system permease protein